MGEPAVESLLSSSHLLMRCQRSQTPPEQIILPDEVEEMEVDPVTPPGGVEDESRFRQQVLSAEKVFLEYRDGPSFPQRVNREVLRQLCQDRQLDTGGQKKELYAQLVIWVYFLFSAPQELGSIYAQRDQHHPREHVEQPVRPIRQSRSVLGKDILREVWEDMRFTELPSWMSPAPPNWGTATRGKLTADQWMVVCTVHLPVTLIRIWGHLQDRRFSILCNFMDLTSSVQLSDQRVIDEQIIADSEMLMSRYLNTMKTLFKDARIKPIHHTALHAGDFLRLFGPNHSVRAFGGERYLEVLGLQNVNNKSGSLCLL